MQVLEDRRTGIEEYISRATSMDELANAQAQLDKVRAQADAEFDRVRSEMVRLDEEMLSPVRNNPEYAGINLQIEQLTSERDKLVAERDREIQQATEAFERQRESYTKRIGDAQASGDAVLADRYVKELAQLKNPRNAIVQRYEARITTLDAQVADLRGRLRELLKTNTTISDATRTRVETRRSELEKQLVSLEAQWAPRLAAARDALANAQDTSAGKQSEIEKARKELDGVGVALAELEQERIPMARNDQVRRLAGRIYGERPEDVTTEQESFVSLLWFGSLAALAALAGPIVAAVALGLQRVAEHRQTHADGKLGRLIRRMLLRWRFRRTRKVEVKVEVPVEKEVEKRIEVPVERTVKEILYVPILTDDPELLRKTLVQDLPPEIADLVKVGMKGQPNGNPA
jgi:hypothetical protein